MTSCSASPTASLSTHTTSRGETSGTSWDCEGYALNRAPAASPKNYSQSPCRRPASMTCGIAVLPRYFSRGASEDRAGAPGAFHYRYDDGHLQSRAAGDAADAIDGPNHLLGSSLHLYPFAIPRDERLWVRSQGRGCAPDTLGTLLRVRRGRLDRRQQ